MLRRAVGWVTPSVSKYGSAFIFRVKLDPEDEDLNTPRNNSNTLEHLHFHQYRCEGRHINDKNELRFVEPLQGHWEEFRDSEVQKKSQKMNKNEQRGKKKNSPYNIYSKMTPKSV
jgi:hypothetical protein